MLSALFVLALAASAPPQADEQPPVVAAIRLTRTDVVRLDGRLTEDVWRRASPATRFRQLDPNNGAPATEVTEVRIVFDDHRLVLGIVCFDSDAAHLHRNQMQRDQSLAADDRFMIALDTYLNGRTGYYFEINPSGAMGDGLIVPGTGGGSANNVNRSWDGIWDARVARTPEGWSAEIEIPFLTLTFDPDVPAWGINFQRTVRRINEESLWTAFARNQGVTFMAGAGRLTGLTGLTQGIGADLRPYFTGSMTQAPGRGAPDTLTRGTYGGDLFYSVTPRLRANVTVNTDFAETEVDQRQVNLTRFPLFFPEKRTFFLEGSSFFDFSREPGNTIVPFFSRRIGLDDNGVPQPINYGVKLTGQAGAFDLGVMHLATRDTARAPGETFTILRARRRARTESFFGGMYTRRAGDGLPERQTAGVDVALATSRLRGRQLLELSGFWLTTVSSAPDARQGFAYGARLAYPNDPLNLRISVANVDADYSPAAGFVERRAYRRISPAARLIRHTSDNPVVRRYSFEVDVDARFDPDGRIETRRTDLQVMRVDMQSGDQFELHLIPTLERLPRPFTIFSPITLPEGSTYSFFRRQYRFLTAGRRMLSVDGRYEDGSFYSGSRRQLIATVSLRPRAGWLIGFTADRNAVELREGTFATTLWRTDVNTQFSPRVALTQNVQYDTVTKGLGWQARFRWIRRPGDDLYVVYTHNWIDSAPLTTFDRRGAVKVVKTVRF